MQKVLDGILKFRKTVRADLVKQFERVRDNPNPTAVFFTCMDSRFVQTNSSVAIAYPLKRNIAILQHPAGTLHTSSGRGYVRCAQLGEHGSARAELRLVARMHTRSTLTILAGISGYEVSVTTEPAALELAVKRGKIKHVIVCGHSDCKAINTLYNLHTCTSAFDPESPMDHWLRKHGYSSIRKLEELKRTDSTGAKPIEFVAENPSLLRSVPSWSTNLGA